MSYLKKKPFRGSLFLNLIVSIVVWVFFWVLLEKLHLPNSNKNEFLYIIDMLIHHKYVRHFSWLIIGILAFHSILLIIQSEKRSKLLNNQKSINSINNLSWQEFEVLVGEAYNRLGFKIEETGLGGADGGVDLILKKNNKKIIVQCKKWKTNKIGVSVVREMFGLMLHYKADEVKIVCSGCFTKEAVSFSKNKPINLVNGEELLHLIKSLN